MLRHVVVAIALTLLFAPAARAATSAAHAPADINIDADKTPAYMFSSDCAVCHKSTIGLSRGMGRSALAAFLAEHYTSDKEEAAALAAFVLAGGGNQKPKRPPPTATAKNKQKVPVRAVQRAAKPKKPVTVGEAGPPAGRPKRPTQGRSRAVARTGVGPAAGRPAAHAAVGVREPHGPATAALRRHPPLQSDLEFAPPTRTAAGAAAANPPLPRDEIPD